MRRLYEELESNDMLMSVKSPRIAVGVRKNSVELLSLSYVGVR